MGIHCMTQGTQTGLCDRLKGGMGREMGGRDMGVPVADSY